MTRRRKAAAFTSGAVLVSCLAVLAFAQTRRPAAQKLVADVPFDFMVDQYMLPAGSYKITVETGHTFQLQAQHGRESIPLEIQPIRTVFHPEGAALVFAKGNGHVRLCELWVSETTGGTLTPPPIDQLYAINSTHLEIPLAPQ